MIGMSTARTIVVLRFVAELPAAEEVGLGSAVGDVSACPVDEVGDCPVDGVGDRAADVDNGITDDDVALLGLADPLVLLGRRRSR